MKSSTTKLMTAFFVVAAIISLSFITKAKKETPKPKYTGHWIAVSGNEYMEVESAEIAEDAFQKDGNGKVDHIDENKVARKLNFKKLSKIEGKNVDAHYFIIGQDEATDAVNMVTPTPKKVWNLCNQTYPYSNFCKAISACFGFPGAPPFTSYLPCSNSNQNYCIGYEPGKTMIAPHMYYVLCTTYSNN